MLVSKSLKLRVYCTLLPCGSLETRDLLVIWFEWWDGLKFKENSVYSGVPLINIHMVTRI